MDIIAVITTVGDRAEARQLARTVIERRLAACAQISEIESFYYWEDAVQNDPEWRLLFKTTAEGYPALEQAIRELHSYDLPAIHALPVTVVYPPYGDWVAAEVSKS